LESFPKNIETLKNIQIDLNIPGNKPKNLLELTQGEAKLITWANSCKKEHLALKEKVDSLKTNFEDMKSKYAKNFQEKINEICTQHYSWKSFEFNKLELLTSLQNALNDEKQLKDLVELLKAKLKKNIGYNTER